MFRRTLLIAVASLTTIAGWAVPAGAVQGGTPDVTVTIAMIAPRDSSGAACAGQSACTSFPGTGVELSPSAATGWTMKLLEGSQGTCFGGDFTSWVLTDAGGSTLYGSGFAGIAGTSMAVTGGTGRFLGYRAHTLGYVSEPLFLSIGYFHAPGTPIGLPCTGSNLWAGVITLDLDAPA